METDKESRTADGCIFNIQRYTVHDGPGIRTEIFLKGCPLRCRWCSNPESMSIQPETGVYSSRCIGVSKCGYCLKACPLPGNGAIITGDDIVTGIDRSICTNCLQCADACPSNAVTVWGKRTGIKDVMKVILSDTDFYEKSGGGVTLSGGEPLLQPEFTSGLLNECIRNGIHTCVESSLNVQGAVLQQILPLADLLITDIKHMDSAKHREYTGAGNELILENIITAAEQNRPLIIRIPVVPEHNDDDENIHATAVFIRERLGNRLLQLQLLPYRQLGTEKYASLGREYPMDRFTPPDRAVWEMNILRIASVLRTYGIPAVPGTGSSTGLTSDNNKN